MIVRDLGRLDMRDMQPVQFDRCSFTKAMDDFALFEADPGFFFDLETLTIL